MLHDSWLCGARYKRRTQEAKRSYPHLRSLNAAAILHVPTNTGDGMLLDGDLIPLGCLRRLGPETHGRGFQITAKPFG